ncbi:MAG: DUF4124 domain-containing protein [Gammaproteobacteria bacterium]
MKIFFTILLCAVMVTAFADQVYRWVDKDGNVHYSQTPPASTTVHANSVNFSAPAPDPVGQQNAQNLVRQMQAQNKQAEDAQQQAAAEAQQQAQQQQRCNQLQAELHVMQQVNRVVTVDAKGNRTYLTDAQHEQQEQQLQDQINKECSSATH